MIRLVFIRNYSSIMPVGIILRISFTDVISRRTVKDPSIRSVSGNNTGVVIRA